MSLNHIKGLATYNQQVEETIVTVNSTQSGTGYSDVKVMLREWRRLEYKILVVLLPPAEARNILCQVI